jgi:hypothetical protein
MVGGFLCTVVCLHPACGVSHGFAEQISFLFCACTYSDKGRHVLLIGDLRQLLCTESTVYGDII